MIVSAANSHYPTYHELGSKTFNPLTPKTDERNISPAASPKIFFIAYSEEKIIIQPVLITSLHISLKPWENVTYFLTWEWKG